MSENTIKLTHMMLAKENFCGLKRTRVDPDRIRIVEPELTVAIAQKWIKTIGEDSGWDKRKENQEAALRERIESASAKLWELHLDNNPIGCALCTETINNLSEYFGGRADLPAKKAHHFYKFGLDPDNREGMSGIGPWFATRFTAMLLEKNDILYANTREENAVKSIKFWGKVGFEVIGEEYIPDDRIMSNG